VSKVRQTKLVMNPWGWFKEVITNMYITHNASMADYEVEVYETHDNGARPFTVTINRKLKQVKVEMQEEQYFFCNVNNIQLMDVKTPKVFDYDTMMLGIHTTPSKKQIINTVLFNLADDTCTYVFVGNCCISFVPHAPIVSYVSPIGNSDVPYPYARDEAGYTYLLIEDVCYGPSEILTDWSKEHDVEDYDFYYNVRNISNQLNYIFSSNTTKAHAYSHHYIEYQHLQYWVLKNSKNEEVETFSIQFTLHPERQYERLVTPEPRTLYLKTTTPDSALIQVTKDQYVSFMTKISQKFNFSTIPRH